MGGETSETGRAGEVLLMGRMVSAIILALCLVAITPTMAFAGHGGGEILGATRDPATLGHGGGEIL